MQSVTRKKKIKLTVVTMVSRLRSVHHVAVAGKNPILQELIGVTIATVRFFYSFYNFLQKCEKKRTYNTIP